MSTRVLVADDSPIFRRVVAEALTGLPGVEIAGTAENGRVALRRLAELKPDVLTLDIEMPEMNGIEVLESMRGQELNTSVIVLSAQTMRGGRMTIRALEAGAFDFITKPEGGSAAQNLTKLREDLRSMIQALERQREIRFLLSAGSGRAIAAEPLPRSPALAHPDPPRRSGRPVVLIGVSTGGPSALAELLPALPAKIGAPVFVVQHMPPHFTQALAERLAAQSSLPVREACDGEIALPDCVYIAPGGRQMKIVPGAGGMIVIRITDDPPENCCRPSADYLFRSAATHFPGRSVAVILTGMGRDGTEGLRLLKNTGSFNIAQDEASCVVFGMPREAILAGVVNEVRPLGKIAESIMRGISGVRA